MWSDEVAKRKFFTVPFQCLLCNSIVTIAAWKAGVGPTMYTKFIANLHNLFEVRCYGCEVSTSVLNTALLQVTDEDKLRVLGEVRSACIAVQDATNEPEKSLSSAQPQVPSLDVPESEVLKITEKATNEHASPPQETRLMELVEDVAVYKPNSITMLIEYCFATFPPETARDMLIFKDQMRESTALLAGSEQPAILCLLDDVERRVSLYHAVLRRPNSALATVCCRIPMCFNCKSVDDFDHWDAGQTCEQRVEQDLDNTPVEGSVFVCPACLVPFVHAGGCSWMRCLCGNEFSIENGEHRAD